MGVNMPPKVKGETRERYRQRVLLSNASDDMKAIARAEHEAECLTPGAIYTTSIHNPPQVISLSISLPNTIKRLNYDEAKKVELKLHKAAEKILASLFKSERVEAKRRLAAIANGEGRQS